MKLTKGKFFRKILDVFYPLQVCGHLGDDATTTQNIMTFESSLP
jgi:hypothetical protein